MSTEIVNNLKAFLFGGYGAPEYAPEGLLALRRLSVEKLARASNVTRTAVYNYINNINRPTAMVLRRMGEALDVPFEEMTTYCTPGQVGPPRTKRE